MSLEKGIASGQERRRPWYDSRAIDGSCANHKGCSRCLGNRLYQAHREELRAQQEAEDLERHGPDHPR